MQKRTRNTLFFLGVAFSLILLGLRIEYQFGSMARDLGMFSELLGYEGDKNYAVLLFDRTKEPLLFLATVSEGNPRLVSITPAGSILRDIPRSDFVEFSDVLTERIVASKSLTTVDVVGFITSEAAGRLTGTLKNVTIGDTEINSVNIRDVVWGMALKGGGEDFADGFSFPKRNLIIYGKELLSASKNVFASKEAAVYVINGTLFGKSCLGACEDQIFDYFGSGVSLSR